MKIIKKFLMSVVMIAGIILIAGAAVMFISGRQPEDFGELLNRPAVVEGRNIDRLHRKLEKKSMTCHIYKDDWIKDHDGDESSWRDGNAVIDTISSWIIGEAEKYSINVDACNIYHEKTSYPDTPDYYTLHLVYLK